MALSPVKTWGAEILTFGDLNNEFLNILNNPGSLITPVTFNLTFTDATYDIGASGATRPRDLFLSRNAVVGGTLAVTGITTFTAAPAVSAGIQFPATQAASADANNLDDYEEGTWTPTDASGGGLTLTTPTGTYEKIGRMFIARFSLVYPATADGSNATVGAVPFTVANTANARQGFVGVSTETTAQCLYPTNNATTIPVLTNAGAAITNATMSTDTLVGTVISHI